MTPTQFWLAAAIYFTGHFAVLIYGVCKQWQTPMSDAVWWPVWLAAYLATRPWMLALWIGERCRRSP